ncbi:methyltransferase domain-containing protein [Novosphingobium album (ex Liu et al. 2023)]|uniref:Methyltransferase domain-containing protein n=1 Tax=Novosphingobium album (ex Liu et al. 2023) TaxID=3031130 RepID=A0ABT5WX41_9SPHN|nr:methyltransferase domain-containing protein [Novosphingobium album (ex Liu et al. 2023)]MDE8654411.1 methyltransferase domain-containing protein [Novosphingobium album (ex Liu et al. 2023)]
MARFTHRSRAPEMMDAPDVDYADFADCMADLAQVNTLTLARGPTLGFVTAGLAHAPADRVPLILDVGYGAGDMLRAIARRLAARGLKARLVGIDLNPRSEPAARALTPQSLAIAYRTGDAFAWPAGDPPDLVISSLVTHHMTDAEIVRFLGWMEANSRLGWFVNDLHRHALAYHGFRLLSGAMRWHRFVRHDGPLSVARSFRRADWDALLRQAGLGHVTQVRWRFPFRYCVARRKW